MHNGTFLQDFLGILVGHIYYYLEVVFPRQEGGFEVIKTPEFLKRLLNEGYLERLEEIERARVRNLNRDNNISSGENQVNQNEGAAGAFDFGGDDLEIIEDETSSSGSEDE